MNHEVLQVSGLAVAYGTTLAVRDVDLTVRRGEVVALVGASGSGKSTLAQAILGLLPGNGRVVAGSVRLAGSRVDALADRDLNRLRGARMALVPQDPGVGLNPIVPVGRQVAEALQVHGVRADDARRRAIDILGRAGLDRPQDRARQLPGALSGGQRQRVLIGIALACDPDIVIADEPTSALDVTVARRVLDHFDERVAGSGTAVLLVTHDLAIAAERSSRIVVMHNGTIVETGSTSSVLDAPEHDYTAALIAASRPRRATSARSAPDPVPDADPDRDAAVRVRGVRRRFGTRSASTLALDGVDLDVRAGTTLAVVGESGSGKTTLARIVAGLETADSGSVRVADVVTEASDTRHRRRLWRRAQLVHQNPYSALDPRLRIEAIVAEPLRAHRIVPRRERRERVRRLLADVGLGAEFLRRRPHDLSGGQRQRVAIARALACAPDVLVLDEPTSALDVLVRQQVLDLISDLQHTHGISVMLVSHDLGVVGAVADDVVVVRAGQVVEAGPVRNVFAAPEHEYTRSLLSAVPGGLPRTEGVVAK